MKKILLIVLFVFILASSPHAFEPPDWTDVSAVKTADALIFTGPGFFYGIMCQTDATNPVTFAVHDSVDNSGAQLMPSVICTTSATNRMCAFGVDPAVSFTTGLYVDITSSDGSPDFTVYFRGQ